MQAAHRVAKNTGILYAKMAITIFISLYTTRLVLAALGTDDFGLFSIVGGSIAMLGFLNASMAGATQRFMSFAQGAGDANRMNKIFNMSVLLHVIIALVLFVLLEIAGYFFFNGILTIDSNRIETAKLIYQFMIVSTLFTVISVPYDALLNAHENMLFYAILGIIESLLKLIIAFYITYAVGDKLFYYGALMASLSIVLLLINRIYCHFNYPESKIAIRSQYDKDTLKEMSSFASWSLLGSASSLTANYGQGLVLNTFFGTKVNAAQGVAVQVQGQLGAFANTMLKALNPMISKSEGAGNRDLMLKTSLLGSKISFFLMMFFYVPVLIEMPYIFDFWLKEVPQYAIIFCSLGLIRSLIEQLYIPLTSAIAAVGNIRKFQIITSFFTLFPLLFSYLFFIYQFPAYTLYIIFIIYTVFYAILVVYFANLYCGLSIVMYLKDIVVKCMTVFFVNLALSTIPIYFMPEGLERLVLVLFLSTICFCASVWFIGLKKEERFNVKQMQRSLFAKIFK